jgi:ribonucleotide monophosphatase NagD (HAD superfamily)
MSRPKTIMVDLDGVLCTEEKFFERPLAQPLDGAREGLRQLRAAGHTVVVYTARGWGEYKVTKKWLDDHGFEYDGLHMGKPIADVWIDDRAVRFTNWADVLSQL